MYKSTDGVDFGNGAREAPKGWSVTGTLATPDVSGVTPALSVGMQQQFPAGTYTLQFNLSGPLQSAGFTKAPRAVATIEWSTAGNTITRKLLVGDGVSISGIAEGVRVVAVDDTVDDPGQPGFEYELSISLSAGQRASYLGVPLVSPIIPATQTNPFVIGLSVLPALSIAGIPVDSGANLVAIIPGDCYDALTNVRVPYVTDELRIFALDAAGRNTMIWSQPRGGPIWYPLVPGTVEIFLSYVTVNAIMRVTVLFGIDG